MLEIKSTVTEMKNDLGAQQQEDQTQPRGEPVRLKIDQQKCSKYNAKKKHFLNRSVENFKFYNIHLIGIPEKKRDVIFHAIMTEKFSK